MNRNGCPVKTALPALQQFPEETLRLCYGMGIALTLIAAVGAWLFHWEGEALNWPLR